MRQQVVGDLVYFHGGGIITGIAVNVTQDGDIPVFARAVVYVSPPMIKMKKSVQVSSAHKKQRSAPSQRIRQNWSDGEFKALIRAAELVCIHHAKWPKLDGHACTPKLMRERKSTLVFEWKS